MKGAVVRMNGIPVAICHWGEDFPVMIGRMIKGIEPTARV